MPTRRPIKRVRSTSMDTRGTPPVATEAGRRISEERRLQAAFDEAHPPKPDKYILPGIPHTRRSTPYTPGNN